MRCCCTQTAQVWPEGEVNGPDDIAPCFWLDAEGVEGPDDMPPWPCIDRTGLFFAILFGHNLKFVCSHGSQSDFTC